MRMTWADHLHARLAGPMHRRLSRIADPERPISGQADRGRALLAGRFRLAGARVDAAGSVWEPDAPTAAFEAERQGFGWLDDLAAYGTASARQAARGWTREWLNRFGNGHGPGWTLALASDRLSRLLDHAGFLAGGEGGLAPGQLERAFARHQRFAQRRLGTLPGGAEGAAICTRLILAGVSLEDGAGLVARAQVALERLCPELIDLSGAVSDRAPETLAKVFTDLAFAASGLEETGTAVGPEHRRALAAAAPVLRALRHADGHLARFHGGGAGDVARIDAALAAAAARHAAAPEIAMGYGRLSRGRSSVIVDCAAPPAGGKGGRTAHASTLAFEMTVGRRPFIVSSGPGCSFGPDWCAAGRATAAHSTLVVAEASSARFAAEVAGPDVLTEGPRVVEADLGTDRPAARLVAAHSGYAGSHGLIHVRRLDLSLDGGALRGEDLLSAVTEAEKRRFVQARAAAGRQSGAGPGHGLPFAIRFHLHPDVDAELDPALGVVRLMLGNGDGWTFRHASACTIGLDPGVYLEKTRAEPAAARQIVLSGLAMHHATSVKWSLTRDGTAPAFLREVPRIGVEADHEPTSALEDPR